MAWLSSSIERIPPPVHGLRLLSDSLPKVTGQVFSRKYVMLGRLLTHWTDIVGSDLASKTHPAKIRYFKRKAAGGQTQGATLDIATSPAHSTLLHYQKDVILERINQIFGEKWIMDIRFVPRIANTQPAAVSPPRPPASLPPEAQRRLESLLSEIGDPELREKLSRFGDAVMRETSDSLQGSDS